MPSDHIAVAELDAPDSVRVWLGSFTAGTRAGTENVPGELFGDVFLSGDPSGVVSVPRAAFLAALPAREQMFRSAGWKDPELETARYEPLGEHYGALLTTWQMSDLEGSGRTVQLRSTFVLRLHDRRAEVVAYLNDQDLRAVLGLDAANPARP